MEIQMGGGGGGSLNLEILRGGGAQAVLEIQVEAGGGQKTMPSIVRVWIFSGITHSDLVPAGRVFMLSEAIHCFATHNFLLE